MNEYKSNGFCIFRLIEIFYESSAFQIMTDRKYDDKK